MSENITIYVDGSYGHDTKGITRGGVGIHFKECPKLDTAITMSDSPETPLDSQVCEYIALYTAILLSKDVSYVTIYSDCEQAVLALTDRYTMLKENKWLNTNGKLVSYHYILIECASLITSRENRGLATRIMKVRAHKGIVGNNRADKLAGYAMRNKPKKVKNKGNYISLKFSSDICNTVAISAQVNDIHKYLNKSIPQVYADNLNSTEEEYYSMSEESIQQDNAITEVTDQVTQVSTLEESIDEVINARAIVDEHRYAFYCCLQCLDSIEVWFPTNVTKKQLKELAKIGKYTIGYTLCKSCINKFKNKSDYNEVAQIGHDYANTIEELCISKTIFELTPIYKCVKEIYNCVPNLIMNGEKIKFTPVHTISKVCNKQCVARTVDTDNNEVLPYLRFGFLI